MSTLKPSTSTCRCCEHYTPLGQRGGTCSLLNNGLVKSNWKACSFSNPAFSPLKKVNNYSCALSSR